MCAGCRICSHSRQCGRIKASEFACRSSWAARQSPQAGYAAGLIEAGNRSENRLNFHSQPMCACIDRLVTAQGGREANATPVRLRRSRPAQRSGSPGWDAVRCKSCLAQGPERVRPELSVLRSKCASRCLLRMDDHCVSRAERTTHSEPSA